MKQSLVFVVASTVLLASVAGAHVFAPLPDGTGFRGSAKAATPSGQIQSAQLSAKPTAVETRQAPVPLLMRERPPAFLPPAVETVAAKVPATPTTTPNAEGGSFAKGAIEADGYKFVKTIAPGPDGTWRARALRGKTEVAVTVDREGRVSAD